MGRKLNKKTKKYIVHRIVPGLVFAVAVFFWVYMLSAGKDTVKIEIYPRVDKKEVATVTALIDGKPQTMGFEEYILHVVTGEMYADFDPEALKAQALAARTYTYKKIKAGGCGKQGADICDDINHCQAYGAYIPPEHKNKLEYAVYSTKGEIITYNKKPITALYHSTSGGKTEDNVNVFGQDLPYLKSVTSDGEENAPRYRNEERLAVKDIKKRINADGNDIKILSRLPSGRVKTVNVFGKTMSGKALREELKLSSANFDVRIDGDTAVFTSIGYGHGVGLSQVGANAMAIKGKNYQEIIKHYYTGVEITKIP